MAAPSGSVAAPACSPVPMTPLLRYRLLYDCEQSIRYVMFSTNRELVVLNITGFNLQNFAGKDGNFVACGSNDLIMIITVSILRQNRLLRSSLVELSRTLTDYLKPVILVPNLVEEPKLHDFNARLKKITYQDQSCLQSG